MGLGSLIIVAIISGWLILILSYIYTSLAFMAIAKKLGRADGNIVWIPFVGKPLLSSRIAGNHWWPMLFLIGYLIPFVNIVAIITFTVFYSIWMWHVFKAVGRPGWWVFMYPILLLFSILICLFSNTFLFYFQALFVSWLFLIISAQIHLLSLFSGVIFSILICPFFLIFLGVAALGKEKKYGLKARVLKVMAILVPILIFVLYASFLLSLFFSRPLVAEDIMNENRYVKYIVPIKIIYSNPEVRITPLENYYLEPDFYIFVDNQTNSSKIPENCSIGDVYSFLEGGGVVSDLVVNGHQRNGRLVARYPQKQGGDTYSSGSFSLDVKNSGRDDLSYGPGDFNQIFEQKNPKITFIFQSKLVSVFLNKSTMLRDYFNGKKEHESPGEEGCYFGYNVSKGIETIFKVSNNVDNRRNLSEEGVICVKRENNNSSVSALSRDNCTFFKVEIKSEVNFKFNLSEGSEKYYTFLD